MNVGVTAGFDMELGIRKRELGKGPKTQIKRIRRHSFQMYELGMGRMRDF